MNTLAKIKNEIESGKISDKTFTQLFKGLNGTGGISIHDAKDLFQYIWENHVKVSDRKEQQGIDWLLNLWKTPTGKERKNNPFGYREQDVLNDEKAEILLSGYYDSGNSYYSYYIPLWTVCGAETSFQYYCHGGNIHIVW